MTFLFTDIEGSTRLLHDLGASYADVLANHRRILRTAIAEHDGVEVDTQGDALFAAFAHASGAVAAAREAQHAFAGGTVRVRMGIHTGEPTLTDEGYVGIDVHRGARICSAGHGGQVLLSKRTRELLDPVIEVRDMGEHRLKDLREAEWLFQLVAPGLESRFPPLRSISNTNLPVETSQFVGRGRELAEVVALLGQEDVRLLTLTGPGGAGKTRLAIRLAGEFVEQFKNGVFFVPLAAVNDPARVMPAVAETLGVRESADEATFEALRRHIEGRQLLLVLDNFEQVVSAAPDLARLLGSAPQLKALVTSRERLRLAGEHEYPVPPLPEEDALTLFESRARAAKPSFRVGIDREPVLAICRRLDGLPLALELAAARVKVMAPQALLARLERRLPTLTGGARDLPVRQQTLRATIEWSYLLLDEGEQRIFTALSIFVGGWTAAAAEAVCGATFDNLASLLDKSLLYQEDGLEGLSRFSMLETIREYARERIERSGEAEALARSHARYFESLVNSESEGRGHGEGERRPAYRRTYGEWIAWLASERENLRVALAWLIDHDAAESAVEFVLSTWRLWMTRGPLAEGQAWTEKVLALPRASESPDFGWFVGIAAEFPRVRGELARARELDEQAIALLRHTGDKPRLATCIEALANIVQHQGDLQLARGLHEESLKIARELADDDRVSHALNGLAGLAFRQRDYVLMEELAEEEVAASRRSHRGSTPECLGDLAEARRRVGKLDSAAQLFGEALEMSVNAGDTYLIGESIEGLADVAAARHDFETATQLWAAALRLIAETDSVPWDPEGTEEGKTKAHSALGPERFDALWRRGQSMTEKDAVANAMNIALSPAGPERATTA